MSRDLGKEKNSVKKFQTIASVTKLEIGYNQFYCDNSSQGNKMKLYDIPNNLKVMAFLLAVKAKHIFYFHIRKLRFIYLFTFDGGKKGSLGFCVCQTMGLVVN